MNMTKLEKALVILNSLETAAPDLRISPLSITVVIFLFLGFMLSVPLTNIGMLIWFGVWLALIAPWLGVSFGSLLKPAFILLPFIALIGIFNPLFDHERGLVIYGVSISKGWLSFAGIIIRGLLAVSSSVMLIRICGFRGFCHSLNHLRVPTYLVTQLLMVFRYLKILLEEALTMRQARESRGYGKNGLPLRDWGSFIGALFIRSVERSERIHRAMLSRGFNGKIPDYFNMDHCWKKSDTVFIIFSLCWFLTVRFWDIIKIF